MKTIPLLPSTSMLQFPTPESGAAIASPKPPSLGAFPTGRRGCGVIEIAVPAVITVGIGDDVPILQAISEAVAMVRRSDVFFSESSKNEGADEEWLSLVDCVPLADSDQIHVVCRSAIREEFLILLSDAVEAVRFGMKRGKSGDPREIDQTASEVHGILDLLRLSRSPAESMAS